MKIFILALDGLEYTLVLKWRLKGLMQKVNGWIDASEIKNLLTPIIWASFITGQPPEIHKIKSWWSISNNTTIDSFFHWIYNYLTSQGLEVPRFKLRKILNLFGLDVKSPQKSDLLKKGLDTIFNYAVSPIVIDVPSYNESADTRIRYSIAMEGGISIYENEIWKIHNERVNKIFNKIHGDWDLFMAWIDLADQMGHLWMGRNKLKMLKAYMNLETLTQRIKKELPEDTLFMVVSDHGMTTFEKYPIHSNRAYYSFNKEIGWVPQSIMDYAGFIKNVLNE